MVCYYPRSLDPSIHTVHATPQTECSNGFTFLSDMLPLLYYWIFVISSTPYHVVHACGDSSTLQFGCTPLLNSLSKMLNWYWDPVD
ncbi:hypothetical protein C0J52_13581 [Blattella germanica]|nr:hypothetical protein C0J52_13581 [Blattella germanica]